MSDFDSTIRGLEDAADAEASGAIAINATVVLNKKKKAGGSGTKFQPPIQAVMRSNLGWDVFSANQELMGR